MWRDCGSPARLPRPCSMASPRPAAPCLCPCKLRVKAGDRDTATFESSAEIYREHDLSQFALTIGSGPTVAEGQHYVAEVDRLLSGRRDVHDPRWHAVLDKRQ